MADKTAQDIIAELKTKLSGWHKDLGSTEQVSNVKKAIFDYLNDKHAGVPYLEKVMMEHIASVQTKIGTRSR